MNLKKSLATGLWILLAMTTTSVVASSDFPKQVRVSATSTVTAAPGPNDRSEARDVCGDTARYWADGSDHWAVYQRLADRGAADSQTRPDFSGDWILNADASDDLLEKAKEAMQASRQARGGGSGGMGRGGGMGGGHQGRGGMGGMSGGGGLSSSELSALLAPAQELHITHHDPMLLIADENEQRQRIFTDFRGSSVSANGGLQQRVSVAGWEGASLVVETTMLGKKMTQNYHVDGGTGQLVVTTQAQVSEAPPVSYRLVYDRRMPDTDGKSVRQDVGTALGEM